MTQQGWFLEDAEFLLATGETHPEAIARRLGYHRPASLRQALRRANRQDLIARIWPPQHPSGALPGWPRATQTGDRAQPGTDPHPGALDASGGL